MKVITSHFLMQAQISTSSQKKVLKESAINSGPCTSLSFMGKMVYVIFLFHTLLYSRLFLADYPNLLKGYSNAAL
jgi:hypothetical protein